MDLVTEAEAARRLHLRPSTLKSLRRRGEGPNFVRLGQKTFYTAKDLEGWVRSCTHTPEKGGLHD